MPGLTHVRGLRACAACGIIFSRDKMAGIRPGPVDRCARSCSCVAPPRSCALITDQRLHHNCLPTALAILLEGLRDLDRCLEALKGLYGRLNARLEARVTAHIKAATNVPAAPAATTAAAAPAPAADADADAAAAPAADAAAAPAADAAATAAEAAATAAAAATEAQRTEVRDQILLKDEEDRAKWLSSHKEVVLHTAEDHIAYAPPRRAVPIPPAPLTVVADVRWPPGGRMCGLSRHFIRHRAAWYATRKARVDANAARFGPRRTKANKDDPVIKALQAAAPEHERTRYSVPSHPAVHFSRTIRPGPVLTRACLLWAFLFGCTASMPCRPSSTRRSCSSRGATRPIRHCHLASLSRDGLQRRCRPRSSPTL